MTLRIAATAVVLLAVTTVLAQGTPPVPAPAGTPLTSQRHALAGRRGMSSAPGNQAASTETLAELRQRMEDMQGTLVKMHTVLKQMRAKAVKGGGTKDPLVKANLDMWELMLGHLDKQFEELKAATLSRADLEARRAALYKQADEKAAAEARAAQSSFAGQAPAPIAAGQSAGQGTAGQTPASQTSPTPPASASPSPN